MSQKVNELVSNSEFNDNISVIVIKDGVTMLMSLEDVLQKALRVDKPSEISAVNAKTSVANADLMMIEDSENSNNKKKVTKAQFLNDVAQVTSGSEAPISTPTKLGQVYVTEAGQIYMSKGTASSDDWVRVDN